MAEHQVMSRFLGHDSHLCDLVSHTLRLIGRPMNGGLITIFESIFQTIYRVINIHVKKINRKPHI